MTITFLACWLAMSSPSVRTCERVTLRLEPGASALFCLLTMQQAVAAWQRDTAHRDPTIVGPITCEAGERT